MAKYVPICGTVEFQLLSGQIFSCHPLGIGTNASTASISPYVDVSVERLDARSKMHKKTLHSHDVAWGGGDPIEIDA